VTVGVCTAAQRFLSIAIVYVLYIYCRYKSDYLRSEYEAVGGEGGKRGNLLEDEALPYTGDTAENSCSADKKKWIVKILLALVPVLMYLVIRAMAQPMTSSN
jgi:hypothetical protein